MVYFKEVSYMKSTLLNKALTLKNELFIHAITRRNFKKYMLSEKCQAQKHSYYSTHIKL